ncbi:PepSY-associated TM helix domain-containing protein [Pseudemcibacter aquimaris]|uniref:PepSY-associated TM helix domain-containing protein n=1 Tax=Pseudemcibacter aquimaris TaxID=2857064 RepID=UPI002012A1E9|nr:PepSY-associated TM helix domain-containing protein [Pseudemcibacter aquimaris]MCC3860572.1 PepSY domain-containing protein [Pseudemcibacter aquimaris]WDU59395.1 PepSY domain-containing protein [Pseudemcibacter aquimaris]
MANSSIVKKSLNAHSAIALAVSGVLYIICLSGTISVFKDELMLFENRTEPVVSSISGEAAEKAAANAIALDPETAHLFIHMPADDNKRAIVETDNKEHYIDENGNIIAPTHYPWNDFLINLHYYLNIPSIIGMVIVAIFGVFLFAISLSGFFAHPNIFKDAFSFRLNKSEQIKQVDLHNRLSVWTSPFIFAVTLSGTMIGLSIVAALFVGYLKYDGDYEAVFEPVFGAEPEMNLEKAPLVDFSKAFNYLNEHHPDKPMVYVILHDPGTKGQYLQIMAEHPRRLIYAEKYNFNGDAEFVGTVGSADGTIGQQIADSMYKIHFGYFGGYPIKFAYFLFGIALLYIIHSGTKIYFIKQASAGNPLPQFEAAWAAVIWATPSMLVTTYVISFIFHDKAVPLAPIFWLGHIGFIAIFVMKTRSRLSLLSQVDPQSEVS